MQTAAQGQTRPLATTTTTAAATSPTMHAAHTATATAASAPGRRLRLLAALLGSGTLAACMHGPMHGPGGHGGHGAHAGQPHAKAELQATRGHSVSGTVMFHQEAGGVFMHARLSGLKPNQAHGFHVHEKGDCSSGDGMSAGGHFNPTAQPHGPQHAAHHAGDLPALQADAQGRADLKVSLPGLSITGGATNVVGRALIVHADPDDYQTQPTGNSGARIACGVVTGP